MRFDIIADHRQAPLLEPFLPVIFPRDKDRDAIDKAAAGLENLFDIPLGGLLRPNRQVIDHDVGTGFLKHLDHIAGRTGGFLDDLRKIITQSVMGHAAVNLDVQLGHVAKFKGVIGFRVDGRGQVFTDFIFVYIESR